MSTAGWITLAVIGFFALIAILVFLRLLFRKHPPDWTHIKMGVYIERVPSEHEQNHWERIGFGEDDTEVLPPK